MAKNMKYQVRRLGRNRKLQLNLGRLVNLWVLNTREIQQSSDKLSDIRTAPNKMESLGFFQNGKELDNVELMTEVNL